MTRLLVSHAEGWGAEPELELDLVLEGDIEGQHWTGRPTDDSAQPPPTFVEGPVVVTLLDGAHEGRRADAWAKAEAQGVMLVGASPFVAMEA